MKDGEGSFERWERRAGASLTFRSSSSSALLIIMTVLSLTIEITQLSSQNAMVSWHQCLVWNIWIVGFEQFIFSSFKIVSQLFSKTSFQRCCERFEMRHVRYFLHLLMNHSFYQLFEFSNEY